MDIASLMEKTSGYLPAEKLALIEKAYHFALQAHQGQRRKSGEPYLEHPLETANILVDLQLGASSLVAALLHDSVEDCGVTLAEIEDKFGPEISKLVDGTTKLSRLSWKAGEKRTEEKKSQAENLRKMLVAMAEDLRVVFIKLADRLHNMRTLGALTPGKQNSIAQETLEIYAPLAHRLGIWELKWQLEDLSFKYLDPQKYHRVVNLVAAHRDQREGLLTQIAQMLRDELQKGGVKTDIAGRPKHIYSIHQKMEKYASQGKHFGDIHDLLALRVLVDTVADCYSALGILHNLWRPYPEEFNDFIANPKGNGYQSLHTTVMCFGTTLLEVQIRTQEMHRISEYGVAAHWRYKEGEKRDLQFEQKIAWLRQLLEWQRELPYAEEFLESVKTDILIDQVFVYTPKGEIKGLPKGATSLDFAYYIHTDLGHRCIGAKVNSRLIPLSYQLNNGDTVEILSAKRAKGPSRDWLNPNLGFVSTSHARGKIRYWFKQQEKAENIERGKQLLEKELRRLSISLGKQEEIARLFKYESLDDFFAAIGYGGITLHQIAVKVAAQEEQPRVVELTPPSRVTPSGVQVLGVGDLLTCLAHCCHPLPGDEIIGYITRNRGVAIHRKDCHSIAHEDEKERLIAVEWGHIAHLYPVVIRVEALDRVGLLRDISAIVAEEKVNIASVSTEEYEDSTTAISLALEIKGVAQLSRLLSKIEGISGVINVARVEN